MTRRIAWPVILYIAILVFTWGVSWPVYKFGLGYAPPILYAGIRTVLGGLLMAVIAFPRRNRLRWRTRWPIYIISSFFNVFLFFGLQAAGLVYLPSGMFSVLVYLEPVLVALLAWRWLGETLTPAKAVGLILGFLGVIACSFNRLPGTTSGLGIALGLAAATSWAIGTVYLKRVQAQVDLIWMVAIQCLIGGMAMIGTGSLVERWSDIHWTWPFLATVAFGMCFGVSTSWLIWFRLVQMGEVSRVAALTFLVPLIAVILSALFLHEAITVWLFAGLVLIAASIYLVNHAPHAHRAGTLPRTLG
ncbi:MAG: DMT family transporter [Kyrpidia sp.]|nr:DMT family transporter [Kyrpidia sp.]